MTNFDGSCGNKPEPTITGPELRQIGAGDNEMNARGAEEANEHLRGVLGCAGRLGRQKVEPELRGIRGDFLGRCGLGSSCGAAAI